MVRTISVALARRAHKNARERTPTLKGLLRIRRYQQETPCATPRGGRIRSWLRFGEAYSALRDWRPIPAALRSHSVVQCSGTEEFLPTTTATLCGRPRRERNSPDKQRSIRKKTCSVKLSSKKACGNKSTGYYGSILACASDPTEAIELKMSGHRRPLPPKQNHHKVCNISYLHGKDRHPQRASLGRWRVLLNIIGALISERP